MINCDIIVINDIPKEQISGWEDKVIYSVARKTLDFTDSGHHFPYLTGELNRASMSEGVLRLGDKEYGLGAKGVEYAPKVWQYGTGTKWTNPDTIPQWYMGVFEKYKSEIMEDAVNTAKRELE